MADEIHDEVFGPLKRDPYLDSWIGKVELQPKQTVQVVLWQYEAGREKHLRREHGAFAWIKANQDRVRQRVARGVVKVYHEHQGLFPREQGRPPEGLVVRMRLVRVGFFQDGKFWLAFKGVRWIPGKDFVLARFGPRRKFEGLDDSLERD
jgi:hypothetical protein